VSCRKYIIPQEGFKASVIIGKMGILTVQPKFQMSTALVSSNLNTRSGG